jgi:glycerol kinase
VARAALEAIAWRVSDIVEAIAAVGTVERVRVDGGLTNSGTLLQIQADALGVPLLVGPADTTALGAAMLAGVGAGLFASVADAAQRLPAGREIRPGSSSGQRAAMRARWHSFVEAAARL